MPAFVSRSLAPIALVLATCLGAQAQTTSTPPARNVVVFGDGYSDAGNFSRETNPGGFVWIEQLLGAVADPNFDPVTNANGQIAATSPMALMYEPTKGTPNATALNAAFVGARAWRQNSGNIQAPDGSMTRNNVGAQIRTFLRGNETLAPDHMVFYMAGANDLMNHVFRLETSNDGQTYLADPQDSAHFVATEAIAALTTLGDPNTGDASGGLGASHVVVLNLPNLAATPRFGVLSLPEVIHAATQDFNAALAVHLNMLNIADPDTDYILVDVATAFQTVLAQEFKTPGSAGFTEVMTPCTARPDGCFAKFSDTNGHFYYNSFLPNSAAHMLIADAVRAALLGAGVKTQALARSLSLIR